MYADDADDGNDHEDDSMKYNTYRRSHGDDVGGADAIMGMLLRMMRKTRTTILMIGILMIMMIH